MGSQYDKASLKSSTSRMTSDSEPNRKFANIFSLHMENCLRKLVTLLLLIIPSSHRNLEKLQSPFLHPNAS